MHFELQCVPSSILVICNAAVGGSPTAPPQLRIRIIRIRPFRLNRIQIRFFRKRALQKTWIQIKPCRLNWIHPSVKIGYGPDHSGKNPDPILHKKDRTWARSFRIYQTKENKDSDPILQRKNWSAKSAHRPAELLIGLNKPEYIDIYIYLYLQARGVKVRLP